MGCYNIAQASSRQEKNEIFVETVGSTIISVGTTALLTLYFVATPTGWITALALGVGAAGLSMGAGKGFKEFYTRSGTKVDLVSELQVDKLCQ